MVFGVWKTGIPKPISLVPSIKGAEGVIMDRYEFILGGRRMILGTCSTDKVEAPATGKLVLALKSEIISLTSGGVPFLKMFATINANERMIAARMIVRLL